VVPEKNRTQYNELIEIGIEGDSTLSKKFSNAIKTAEKVRDDNFDQNK
jgi:hypothetical protein